MEIKQLSHCPSLFLLTPFSFPLSNRVRKGEQLNIITFASPLFFYSPPFYSPSLTELERGNNRKKLFVSPFSFSKEKGKE